MATGQAVVHKAIEQLKATLTVADDHLFSDTKLEHVWQWARKLEKDQAARRELKHMRRIEPYLRSLEAYAGVLEVFVQGYSPMAFVWGPIKLMLQLASNYTGVLENILQAFSDIASVLPRVDKLKATFQNSTDFGHAVALVYSDVIEFHRRVYKFFRCKGWHFWFTFNWGLFELRFKSILHRLSSHCDLLDKEAAAIHFSEMKDFRAKRQVEDDALEQHRQFQMAESVFRWLSAGEDLQEEYLHRISDKRHPETCNWVLDDTQMQAWIGDDGGDPVLWMTGIPGAGKSFLCSLIVENLQTRSDRSSLYYFCGRQPAGGDTCSMILRTFAVQLLRYNSDIVPLVYQAYLQKTSSRSAPAIKKMLCQLLRSIKVTRLVIDGIDEGPHDLQREVLKSLLELQRGAECNCKLLVSSREEPQIQSSLSPKSHLKLGNKTSEGLSLYIKEKVKNVTNHFPEMESSLVNRVADRLNGKAKGMFLWVRLVVAMLMQQTSEAEIEQSIDQLPDGLSEAYGLILSRISSLGSTSKDRAFKILYWVCVSYRPITIYEVADGITLHLGQRQLNRKNRSNNLRRDIVELCAPLLEETSNGILDLVHFSAREYLVDKQSGPFVDIAKAHLSVALSCIINLTTSLELVLGQCPAASDADLETRVVKGSFGLQSYGHEYWAEHSVAYLAQSTDQDVEASNLTFALDEFSHVYKRRSESGDHISTNLQVGDRFAAGLSKLRKLPLIYNFLSSWLHFKSLLLITKLGLETIDAQQQWKLRTDETYLSLIDSRLCYFTEKILSMSSSELPSYIDEVDYRHFILRYKLPCRFSECNLVFDSCLCRNAHEATHVPSFPCLQCDFVQRGFKTRKDLEKHKRKYHMGPEDFEIPANLFAPSDHLEGNNLAQSFQSSKVSSTCWNEQGRKALQQGFRQVLAKVESRLGSDGDVVSLTRYQADVNSMRGKIDTQHYDCLSDFKADLVSLISTTGETPKLSEFGGVGSFCNSEIEKATSEYPSFTNFDHRIDDCDQEKALAELHGQKITGTGSLYEYSSSQASSNNPFHQERKPYWSTTEEKQFPELLQRCGRDFLKISEYLKTKNPAEVNRHFIDLVKLGRTELLEVADRVDASLQSEHPTAESTVGSLGASLEKSQPNVVALNPPTGLPLEPQVSEATESMPHLLEWPGNRGAHLTGEAATNGVQSNAGIHHSPNGPKTRKRKLRQRTICSLCRAELHDEYAMMRHISRFHTATRKVWVCEDISVDKRFLAKCKSCSASKRYRSMPHASKHLRQAHFSNETSGEILNRWMRVTEEPNPKFKESPGEEPKSVLRQMGKRRGTNAKPVPLPPVLFDPSSDHPETLPSIMAQLDQSSVSGGGVGVETSADSDSELDDKPVKSSNPSVPTITSYSDALLADLPFDSVLPRFICDATPDDNDGSPHRANRALIKPDQVSRLPNLDSFRKSACQDQVDALYNRLDTEQVGSARYQEELENLTSLSQTLMRNLRDWRRHSNNAPYIPFSI